MNTKMSYKYRLEDVELDDVLKLLEELNYSEYTTIITVEIDVVRLDKTYTAYIETKIDDNFINELDEEVLTKYSEMYNEEEYFMRERIKQYILSLIENPDPLLPASVDEYIHLLNKENYNFCECFEKELEKTKGLIHFTEYLEYVNALEYINSKASKKYEVSVIYEAFASKKRNDVLVLEFKSTNLKNKIEENDGFKYGFSLASIKEMR